MNKYVLTDTGFWLGLFDKTDNYHEASKEILDLIDGHIILLPFPCLYEMMRTQYVKNKKRLLEFESFINHKNVVLIDDTQYKESALLKVYELNKINYITYSLVDSVLREMISDINLKIDYLVTFNTKDFSDICAVRNLKIIDSI